MMPAPRFHRTFTHDFEELTSDGEPVVYTVTFLVHLGTPGYTAGRPADCFPPGPDEIEFLTATVDGVPITELGLSSEAFTQLQTHLADRTTDLIESGFFFNKDHCKYEPYFEPENCNDC